MEYVPAPKSHGLRYMGLVKPRAAITRLFYRTWRTKGEHLAAILLRGGERVSTSRKRLAGKICCRCKIPFPAPHHACEAGVRLKPSPIAHRHRTNCRFGTRAVRSARPNLRMPITMFSPSQNSEHESIPAPAHSVLVASAHFTIPLESHLD